MLPRLFARWFDHTPFALKFAVAGLAVAGPLLLVSALALAAFHQKVIALRSVEAALVRADHIRVLSISVARHRGLAASVLAGGEGAASALVAEQRLMLAQMDRVVALLDPQAWPGVGLADPAGLRAQLQALTLLPQELTAEENFERHNAIVNQLLAASARLGLGLSADPRWATENDLVFVRLPMLVEDIGRVRGWGSAILTQQQASPAAADSFMLLAGAMRRRLELLQADPDTLARLERWRAGSRPPVGDALLEAQAYLQRSMAAVRQPALNDDAAGRRNFADGTAVIQRVSDINASLVQLQQNQVAADLAAAERARIAAVAALFAVLVLLALLLREFSRSTVLRLNRLGQAAEHLARSDFEQPIHVDGSDEIAQLGQSLDAARLLLRQALAERARGLAAQQADAAKTDFLARWSHDLRTPLNAVLGFADLLENRPGPALSDAQRGDVQRIRQAGQHLLQLVNDVLDISRIEASQLAMHLSPQPLQASVTEAVALLQPEAQAAAVSLNLNQREGSEQVLADPTRLTQILCKLLANAIKFNRPGGRVDVHLRAVGRELVVDVVDSGAGIEPEALSRLFTPFERLDAGARQIPGSGLGLALAQRLAQAMGGRIDVSSRPGQGSCFSLSLPRADDGPAAAAAADAPAGAPPHQARTTAELPAASGRLAYVEDDPVNALLVREMLAGLPGISLSVYVTGEEARQAVRSGERFDLWLIDKQLPDADGVSLLAALNAGAGEHGQPPLRAVMLSADALPGSAAPALAAGFIDYWTKPVALQALRSGVARHLALAREAAPAGLATIGSDSA